MAKVQSFPQELQNIIPKDRVRSKLIDLISYASDAGFYQLIPKAVVQPNSEEDIHNLFKFSQKNNIPLVFRTAGTSLSGQSITDGILVDLSQNWNKIKVEAGGNLVRVQPGVTGALVNTYLKPYRRKIGPDPSSIQAAMIGGILSNNASGMCCGVKFNSYHTLKYIRFILPDGKTFSTEDPDDYLRFESECSELAASLNHLREKIISNLPLYEKIRGKYQTKNTIGYSLNSFIDYGHPLDILAHLLIGAEGTLAFISEAVLETIPDYPFKSTALLYFADIYEACQAIVPLTEAGAMMVEIMDRASLRAIENIKGIPDFIKTLPDGAAALLVEFQEENLLKLEEKVNKFFSTSSKLSLIESPIFTTNPQEQAFLWKIRKGLFPAVGAVRASGTTVILEDIAFQVERLGDAILDLRRLFQEYNYSNAIIFGHAKDGNIHFVITQSFNNEDEITRYDNFIKAVVKLVITKYGGTLKAEHGTGRNMAPFVEIEWGSDAYSIFREIKDLIDPTGLLNPDVILNKDKNAHIKDLKEMPIIEEEVDRCIECGYCEPVCPSKDFTSTPRRRIVARRALEKFKKLGDSLSYKLLKNQYQYDGIDTCAVDGLCSIACPVDINTGDLVKRLRSESHSDFTNRSAIILAQNFSKFQGLSRVLIKLAAKTGRLLGEVRLTKFNRKLRNFYSPIPMWSTEIGDTPDISVFKSKALPCKEKKVVYFPSCVTRMMGNYQGQKKNLIETFLSICQKTDIQVIFPPKVSDDCCSQLFGSKGFREAQRFIANQTIDKLWITSLEGKLPIVTDVSSCAFTLQNLITFLSEQNKKKFQSLKFLDSIEFLNEMVIPLVNVSKKRKNIMLHPVCSLKKMNTEELFMKIAHQFADKVTVPKYLGCCGMAGDRGFLVPELTESATNHEAIEVLQGDFDGYYSTTRTCEIALSEATNKKYESVLYLVDAALK